MFSQALADFSYFWFGLISFELVISFFYKFTKDGRPIARWDHRFKGTTSVITVIIIIGALYYFGDVFLHDYIVTLFASLDITTFPLAIFSISFFAFYTTKIMLRNKAGHPAMKAIISICIISAIATVLLFINGNKI